MKKTKGRNGGTLKSVEKGDPPLNPKGRPKGRTFANLLNKILDKEITVDEAGEIVKITNREKMALKVIEDAIDNKDPYVRLRATELIVNRTEGKPEQEITMNAPNLSWKTAEI